MKFSRATIIHVVKKLTGNTHAGMTQFLLNYGLEDVAPAALGGLEKRDTALMMHLIRNPDLKGPSGASLVFELVEKLIEGVNRDIQRSFGSRTLQEEAPELVNLLSQDGYEIQDGKLIQSMPSELGIAESKDEVRLRLEELEFSESLGHLTQALSAHARSEWAGANAQLRTYVESLFDSICSHLLGPRAEDLKTHHERQEQLARLTPPFLRPDLNEWVIGGNGGFFQGLIKRLHPEGSHPGLSDEEDSTFRLHMVLLASRHLLRRLGSYSQESR